MDSIVSGEGLITNAISSLINFGVSTLDKNKKIAQILTELKLSSLRDSFESIYIHTLVDYGIEKEPRELVKLFGLKEVQQGFQRSFYSSGPSDFDTEALRLLLENNLRQYDVIQLIGHEELELDKEIDEFIERFHHFINLSRTPKELEQYRLLLRIQDSPAQAPNAHAKATESLPQKELDQLPFQELRLGELDEFVGRSEALNWLEDELFQQQKTKTLAIVSVQGAGGMGKTFLAHKFVRQHQAEHTFVEIFVGERPAFDAGMEFLSRLGQDISAIQTEAQLTQALQRQFSKGGGVLVLDDVWHGDVTLLIPDHLNWQTLITTRNFAIAKKLTKHHVLELDKLSLAEAIHLFKIVLKDDFDEAQEADYKDLALHLGLRPYGIRLAANSLKPSDFSRTTPQALLAGLLERGLPPPRPDYTEDDETIRQLLPLLEHCLEQLEKESVFARGLLNQLAVCADEGMEADYLVKWQQQEYPHEDIPHALVQIKSFSLLFLEKQRLSLFGEEKTVERIRLHTDLLNLLREVSLEKERQSLQAFLHQTLVLSGESIESHRSLQFQVNSLIAGLTEDSPNTKSLYDQFWIHLWRTGRLQWAYELGAAFLKEQEKRGNKAGLHVAYGNQAVILKAWGQLEEAMRLHQKQERLCEQLGDQAGLSRTYGNQAVILQAWGQLEEAMRLHQKQERLCEQLGNQAGLSKSYSGQGLILQAWGKLDEAMEFYRKEERLCEQLGDQAGLSRTYGNQAVILKAWGQLEEAMRLHQKEEKLCEQLGDQAGLSACYGNQALILQAWGQLEEAMRLLQKQERMKEQLGDQTGLSACYGNQAVILKAWGQLEEAMSLHQKEEGLCKQLGDQAQLSRSYGNQAVILQAWGQLEEAMSLHQKEEGLCKQLGDQAGLSRSYGNQAVILRAWGKLEEAMSLHQKQERLCEQLGDQAGLSACYGNQAVILQAWGQLEEAMSLHQKEERLCKQLGNKAGLINCYWNMGLLYKQMEDHSTAIEKIEQAIELETLLKHPHLETAKEFLENYRQEIQG